MVLSDFEVMNKMFDVLHSAQKSLSDYKIILSGDTYEKLNKITPRCYNPEWEKELNINLPKDPLDKNLAEINMLIEIDPEMPIGQFALEDPITKERTYFKL